MKKQTVLSIAVAALLVWATHSAYAQSSRTGSMSARIGHRPTANQDLQQFSQAWGISTRKAVAVLVYIRSWLHNLLVSTDSPLVDLRPGDADVLLSYAQWLDGIPQVVRRLPDTVLNGEAKLVDLKAPACLPLELQGLAFAGVCGIERNTAAEAEVVQVTTNSARRPRNSADRIAAQTKNGASFVRSSTLLDVKQGTTHATQYGAPGRR